MKMTYNDFQSHLGQIQKVRKFEVVPPPAEENSNELRKLTPEEIAQLAAEGKLTPEDLKSLRPGKAAPLTEQQKRQEEARIRGLLSKQQIVRDRIR